PEPARHPGPGPPDDELSDRATKSLAMLVYDVRVHPGARAAERAGRDRRPGRAADDAAGDFGAAGVVDDRATLLADVAEVPPPGIRIPWLTGRAENKERGTVLRADRSLACAPETPDRGRREAGVRSPVAPHLAPRAARRGMSG